MVADAGSVGGLHPAVAVACLALLLLWVIQRQNDDQQRYSVSVALEGRVVLLVDSKTGSVWMSSLNKRSFLSTPFKRIE